MLCEMCKKQNANVHVTEIHNTEKRELHLCERCAAAKGVVDKIQFSIPEILGGLMAPHLKKAAAEGAPVLKCPRCGLGQKEFMNKARFGCPNDYVLFRESIRPLAEKIHGGSHHIGKVPPGLEAQLKKESRLLRLRRELDRAVKNEDFEKAAKLRDEIGAIEKENKARE